MESYDHILLPLAFLVAALLYSSVGHAGASAYIAIMAMADFTPSVMKPTALVLNLLVASIASINFARAGHFSWRHFWPFAVTSIPCAFMGGAISAPAAMYRLIVGTVLVFAAVRMLSHPSEGRHVELKPPRPFVAMPLGAIIGFLSGLTGVGGGIFLSPLLVIAGWASIRTASGVAAVFILVNSASGLLGQGEVVRQIPQSVYVWLAAVCAGGMIGSYWGSRRLPIPALRRILAIVLVVAATKLMFT